MVSAAEPYAVEAAIEMIEKVATPWMLRSPRMQCSAWSSPRVRA
jgi:hypothetical protein